MVGEANGHFVERAGRKQQGAAFHVNRFVIDTVRFDVGDVGLTAQDRNAPIGVVEHKIGAVENAFDHHAGRGVGDGDRGERSAPGGLEQNSWPQALPVRALRLGRNRGKEGGLISFQGPFNNDGKGACVHACPG